MAPPKQTGSKRSNKTVAAGCGVLLTAVQISIMIYLVTHQPVLIPLLPLTAILLLYGTPALGALWMVIQALKFERHPLRYILIALFVPYSFVWYYLERARGRQLRDSLR
jgi:tellurite resistance protein TehA-like permease